MSRLGDRKVFIGMSRIRGTAIYQGDSVTSKSPADVLPGQRLISMVHHVPKPPADAAQSHFAYPYPNMRDRKEYRNKEKDAVIFRIIIVIYSSTKVLNFPSSGNHARAGMDGSTYAAPRVKPRLRSKEGGYEKPGNSAPTAFRP